MASSFYAISCDLVLSCCNDSSLSLISVIFRVSPERFLSCGLLQIWQKYFVKCSCMWFLRGTLNVFHWKITVIGFWSETLHSPHWPPLSVNKGGMQSENNELSKSSLCVISGLKRFGNRFTPQTECWFLMWFFFFPPVVWVSPLLAGNYSLCAAVEGSPGPGFGSEATVQHQSNCNTHSRMTIWAQLLSIIIVEFRGDKKKRRY